MKRIIALVLVILLLTGCGPAAGQESQPPVSEEPQASVSPAEVLRAAMDTAWVDYLAELAPELAGKKVALLDTLSASFSAEGADEILVMLSVDEDMAAFVLDRDSLAPVTHTTLSGRMRSVNLFAGTNGRSYALFHTEADEEATMTLVSFSAKGADRREVSKTLTRQLNTPGRVVSCTVDGQMLHIFDIRGESDSLGERCEHLYTLRWDPVDTVFDQYYVSPYVPYEYPVKPGTEEWPKNHATMLAVCQISEEVLTNMTTDALVQTVYDYPLLSDMFAYTIGELAYGTVRDHFNGLQELERRPNGFTALYRHYQANYESMDILSKGAVEAILLFGGFTSEESRAAQAQLDPDSLTTVHNMFVFLYDPR